MSDADDPLARVKAEVAAAGGAAAPAKSVRATGDHVAPVPPGAPEVNFRHKHHGEPTREPWVYRDEAGRVLFYVVRFARAKEGEAELPPSAWTGKEVLPRTLWRDGGRTFWAWKGYPAPRPLYGLQKLALRPAAPVLIVEGEKAADAAAARFVEFVVSPDEFERCTDLQLHVP